MFRSELETLTQERGCGGGLQMGWKLPEYPRTCSGTAAFWPGKGEVSRGLPRLGRQLGAATLSLGDFRAAVRVLAGAPCPLGLGGASWLLL